MPFLYYIPRGPRNIGLDEIRKLGLGYAIDTEIGLVRCPCTTGPDGNGGLIIALAAPGKEIEVRYKPAEQTWRSLPPAEGADLGSLPCWVGYYTQTPPGPAAGGLARPKMLDGHWVTLGDGNEWLVPVARGASEQDGEIRWYAALPRVMTLDSAGGWAEGDVVAEYATLWEIAGRWWDALQSAFAAGDGKTDHVEVDFQEANDGALRVLQTNYRLGRIEVAALGLFTTTTARDVLNAAVAMPTLLAFLRRDAGDDAEKKTTPGSGDSGGAGDSPPGDGSPGLIADTDPPSPTSGC